MPPEMMGIPNQAEQVQPPINPMQGGMPMPDMAGVPQEQEQPTEIPPEDRDDKVIKLKLTEEEKKDFIRLIKNEMQKIVQEYSADEYYDKIEQADTEYDGIKEATDFPFTDSSNRKLLLTTTMIEIVSSTAKRQTLYAQPITILELENDNVKDVDLRDNEDYLDHKLRKEMGYEEFALLNYQTACKYGASITAIELDNDIETFTYKKTYSLENIKEFEEKYADKLVDPSSKEFKEWSKIQFGETIDKTIEEDVTMNYGPKLRNVPLDKFFARLKIKEFRRHRVIAEQMDFVWLDIENRMNTGFYDEDAVIELKQRNSKFESEEYKIYQAIVKKEYKGKTGRFVITFDDRTEIILRAIYYPYRHNKVFYVATTPFPKTNSWKGYSFTERMKDVGEIANTFVNSAINDFTLAHTPVILCDDPQFAPERETVGSMSVLKFQKGTQFSPMKFEYSSMDRVNFLNWIQNFGELTLGVSASLMSGKETPSDPRAPNAKTQLKYNASTLRVEDIISSMQLGDSQIIEQVDALCEQYLSMGNKIDYYSDGMKKSAKVKGFGNKVRYIIHGTRMSFDKQKDFVLAMQMLEMFAKFYPELLQDNNVRLKFLYIILNNVGGAVEKNKKTLVEPLEMAHKFQEMVRLIQWKLSNNQPLNQEETAIAQKLAQLQQAQQAQGTPQQGAMPTGGQMPPQTQQMPPQGQGM